MTWQFLIDPNKNTNRQSYKGNYFFVSGNFYIAKLESLKIFKSFSLIKQGFLIVIILIK